MKKGRAIRNRQGQVEFTFPVQFYSRGCVDWNNPNPARGFKGLAKRPITLTTANTAIACMHPSNIGYPDGPGWSSDSPHAWWTGKVSHAPRIREITDNRIAPLIDRARSMGIRILYLIQGWKCAWNYPQFRKIADRVKETEIRIPRSPNEEWIKDSQNELYGPDWHKGDRKAKALQEILDIAPPITPQPSDWVVTTTAQASTLLSEHGIWNILYTGFDTSGCVLWSEGGLWKMRALGYRRILLRDCTTGAETADTYSTQALTRAVITLMEMGLAYTADSRDVLAALQKPQMNLVHKHRI